MREPLLVLLVRLLPAEILEIALGHVAGRARDALHFDGVRGFLSGLLNLADEFRAGFLFERLAGSVSVEDLLALRIEFAGLLRVESVHLALLAVGPAASADSRAIREIAFAIAATLLGPTGPFSVALSGAAGTRLDIIARLAHGILGRLQALQLILDVLKLLRIKFDLFELLAGLSQ